MKLLSFLLTIAIVICISFVGHAQAFNKQGARVTIIVHGWNPDNTEPLWINSMANDIITRSGGNGNIATITVTGSSSSLNTSLNNWNFDLNSEDNCEIVVLVNWTAVANHIQTGVTAQSVAAVVAPLLYQSNNGQPILAELPIHLIGHSRGGGMIFEIARILGEQGIEVDHLTALDPHPLTNADPQGLMPPFGPGSTIDTPIQLHENILFVDNYWQNIEYPKGQYLNGAYNREFTSLYGGYHNESGYSFTIGTITYNFSDHLNILLAYQGSINLSNFSNNEAAMSNIERGNWYVPYEQSGENTGFYYSNNIGGNRFSTDQPVSGNDAINDGMHNALEGNGSRNPINWTGATWPNILHSEIENNEMLIEPGVYAIAEDDILSLHARYRSYSDNVSVTWYIDIDRNPYNSNEVEIVATTGYAATDTDILDFEESWQVSGLDYDTEYYIYAKIETATNQRYHYTAYAFYIEAPEFQNALNFDGSNDYVYFSKDGTSVFGDNSDNTSFTIEFWFKTSDYNSLSTLISKHSNSGTRKGFFIESDGNESIRAGIANNTNSWTNVAGSTVIEDNQWYHVAFIYDSNTQMIQLWINANLEDENTISNPVFDDLLHLRLASSQAYLTYSNIVFDELRIWTNVRSECDLYTYLNTQIYGTEQDLVAYYKFNQGVPEADNSSETQLSDITGNGNDGYLVNLALSGNISNFITSDANVIGEYEINEDETIPIISSTHTDVVLVSASDNCNVILPDYTSMVVASDNCTDSENLVVTQTPESGTEISGSSNQITLTVSDESGNISQAIFNAVVIDQTPPVITSQHIDQMLNADEECKATVPDYTVDVVASDNCDDFNDLIITQTPIEGTEISGTLNTITIRVEDTSGNFDEVSFNAEVTDITEPVIVSELIDDIIGEGLSCDEELPDYAFSTIVSDNCSDVANILVTQTPAPGTIISGIQNLVTIIVEDEAGNFTETSFNVTVLDNQAPIADIAELPDLIPQCEITELIPPTATDNCSGTVYGTHNTDLPITAQGTYDITWTYTDESGNISTQNKQIIIQDNTAPLPDVDDLSPIIAECEITELTPPTATDNCSGTVYGTHDSSLPITENGTTSITWFYEDENGNISTQEQTAVINDETNPEIVCPENASINLAQGETSYIVQGSEFDPVSTNDNCIVDYLSNNLNSEASLNDAELFIGNSVITWTVFDIAGNSNECNFQVEVNAYTSINKNSSTDITVYPNPAKNLIYIERQTNDIAQIQLYSVTGKLLISKSSVSNIETMNLTNLQAGIYLLHFIDTSHTEITKITKQ